MKIRINPGPKEGRKECWLICIIDMVIVKSKINPGPRKEGRNVG